MLIALARPAALQERSSDRRTALTITDDLADLDRLAVFEFLTYFASAFLTAWFVSGLSLWDLLELLGPAAIAGRYVFGLVAAAWVIRLIVRYVNRRDDPAHAQMPPVSAD